MPNAWDVGSARILASLGFEAIATTSSGHAASLGRMDQRVTLEELLAHVRTMVDAVDVPVSVDAERCFADDADGVAITVDRIAQTGAAGVSIEDYDPGSGIDVDLHLLELQRPRLAHQPPDDLPPLIQQVGGKRPDDGPRELVIADLDHPRACLVRPGDQDVPASP